MKRLSSGQTFFMKKVFPVFALLLIGGVLVAALTQGMLRRNPVVLITPALMLVVGSVVYRKLIWVLADEVLDGGDFLTVRRGDEQEDIPLSNIINVSSTTMTNPPRITLKLAKPSRFGDEIVFSPLKEFSFNVFAKNPVAEDLILRVDAARRGVVRR